MFQGSSLATTTICGHRTARIPAWAGSGSLRMKDAVGGSIQPSSSGLWSPPLGFPLASNQAERMGRRGRNPAARALFLLLILSLLILLLFSLWQAQPVRAAREPGGRQCLLLL